MATGMYYEVDITDLEIPNETPTSNLKSPETVEDVETTAFYYMQKIKNGALQRIQMRN